MKKNNVFDKYRRVSSEKYSLLPKRPTLTDCCSPSRGKGFIGWPSGAILQILICMVALFMTMPVVPSAASLRIGPMKAVEHRAEKLDGSVNEHWVEFWKVSACEGQYWNYEDEKQCALDEGVPSRVIEYWNDNPEEAPLGFTVESPLEEEPTALFRIADEPLGENKGFEKGKLAWADVNRNGRLDLAFVGLDSDSRARLVIFENLGDGEFAIGAEPLGANQGLRSGALAWGDYNNSGYLDLAVMGYDDESGDHGNPRLIIFRNDGNFEFTKAGEPLGDDEGLERGDLIWVDVTNDGMMDLVAVGFDGMFPRFIIFRNTTDITEGPEAELTLELVQEPFGENRGAGDYSAVAAGDFNKNGWVDLAVLGQDRNSGGNVNRLAVLENRGLYATGGDTPDNGDTHWYAQLGDDPDSGFHDLIDPDVGLSKGDLAWGDIKGNGSLELIALGSNENNDGRAYVFEYNGKFQTPKNTDYQNSIVGLKHSSFSLGDFNNNGWVDLLVSGHDNSDVYRLIVYENTGNKFDTAIEPLKHTSPDSGVRQGDVAWADYDGRGRLSFAAAGDDDRNKRLMIFENNTQDMKPNYRPDRPFNLGQRVYADTVELTWDAPSDDHTDTQSLSYLLRVGTEGPDGGDINVVSEGSLDHHLYYHQLLGRIHPGQTRAVLNELPPGSYDWSVRAVNSGYMMSRWSYSSSFEVYGGDEEDENGD